MTLRKNLNYKEPGEDSFMYQLKALQIFPNSSFSSEVDIRLISRLSNQISNRSLNANRGQEFSKKITEPICRCHRTHEL